MGSLPLDALRQGWFAGVAAEALQPLGDGHINDTYLVQLPPSADTSGSGQYVLQRLSNRVFTNPEAVMSNVCRVLEHCATGDVPLPELISSRQGKAFWIEQGGAIWRMWRFRARTRVLSAPLRAGQVQLAGWAFGRFQRLMSTLPPPRLSPVIDGFLDLRHYLRMYDQAVADCDPEGCQSEMDFVAATRDVLADRLLPREDCIHGDCKLDNLLFSAGGGELDCVIDLDTVMLGHWAWDFGDLARSIATTAAAFEPELFALAARGFCAGKGIGTAADSSEEREEILDVLLEAPGYVTFMLAVRFLTDHLSGDRYFKVARPGDNLARAGAQIALYRNFAQHLPQLRGLVSDQLDRIE